MILDFDLHIHTFHSACAKPEMKPAKILGKAYDRRIRLLGFTDHYYPFTDPNIYDDTRREAEEALVSLGGDIKVLYGCEVEVMAPGRTAGSPEMAERLDYVMAAATHFQNVGMTDLPKAKDDDSLGHYYLKMFEYAVSLPWVDTIAHPFFVVPGICSVSVLDVLKESDILPALELAKENNIAMEISRRVFNPGQLDFSLPFYRLCKRVGLKFTTGSDAHTLRDIGNIRILRPLFNELGLTEKDFWLPESRT